MRDDARRLLDALPDEDLPMLVRILRGLISEEEEELSEDGRKALRDAEADVTAGRVVPATQVWQELGL